MPLKHLNNFLTFSHLNNFFKQLVKKLCKATRDAEPDANPAIAAVNNPTGATFKITDTTLYVSLVALSTENDNKLSQQLKTGFTKIIR